MINFRYHLVSVAAILLALGAGVALGSGPLDEAGDSLRGEDTVSGESVDPAVRAFEAGYASRTSGDLIDGKLKGQSVVIFTAPGASTPDIKGISTALDQAGAEITGEVALSSKLLNPSGRQFAEGVAQESAAGVAGVNSVGDSYGRIGAALARAFMADKTAPIDSAGATISSAFVEGQLITYTDAPTKVATLAILVTGPQRPTGADQATVVAALAEALNGTGKGIVVAGPASSSTDGGAVKAVRDGNQASEISSVDVTDTAAGRIVTVLAAVSQVAGKPGAWGTSRSAGGAVPE